MIYFVQEKGLFRSRVKIGYTDNVRQRLGQLQGCSPSRLKLVLALPGDEQDEFVYHKRFAAYHLHGEWFKFGIKLKLFVWINQFAPLPRQDDPLTPEHASLTLTESEMAEGRNEQMCIEPDHAALALVEPMGIGRLRDRIVELGLAETFSKDRAKRTKEFAESQRHWILENAPKPAHGNAETAFNFADQDWVEFNHRLSNQKTNGIPDQGKADGNDTNLL